MIRLRSYPMMDEREVLAMKKVLLKYRPPRVLEWGAGGSTIYWPQILPNTEWISIEHNPAYANALRGKTGRNVKVHQIDFPTYFRLKPAEFGQFDLIIVDGRERVRCLNIARDLLKHDGLVLLHDAGRERYQPARRFYQTIQVLSPPKPAKDPRGLWLLKDPRPTKVFGVGLSKTGTNSLNVALERLGFSALHYPSPKKIMELARKHDALTDTPVIHKLKELDARYPGALFILTTREIESWLVSCKAHWARIKPSGNGAWNRVNVYGQVEYDEDVFRQVYAAHNQRIRDYFKDRPWKLLEMDIIAGDGYEKLCPALGLEAIPGPFPHESARRMEQEPEEEPCPTEA